MPENRSDVIYFDDIIKFINNYKYILLLAALLGGSLLFGFNRMVSRTTYKYAISGIDQLGMPTSKNAEDNINNLYSFFRKTKYTSLVAKGVIDNLGKLEQYSGIIYELLSVEKSNLDAEGMGIDEFFSETIAEMGYLRSKVNKKLFFHIELDGRNIWNISIKALNSKNYDSENFAEIILRNMNEAIKSYNKDLFDQHLKDSIFIYKRAFDRYHHELNAIASDVSKHEKDLNAIKYKINQLWVEIVTVLKKHAYNKNENSFETPVKLYASDEVNKVLESVRLDEMSRWLSFLSKNYKLDVSDYKRRMDEISFDLKMHEMKSKPTHLYSEDMIKSLKTKVAQLKINPDLAKFTLPIIYKENSESKLVLIQENSSSKPFRLVFLGAVAGFMLALMVCACLFIAKKD